MSPVVDKVSFFLVFTCSGVSSQYYCTTSDSANEYCEYGCCGQGNCQYCCKNEIALGFGTAIASAVLLVIVGGVVVWCIQRKHLLISDKKASKSVLIQTDISVNPAANWNTASNPLPGTRHAVRGSLTSAPPPGVIDRLRKLSRPGSRKQQFSTASDRRLSSVSTEDVESVERGRRPSTISRKKTMAPPIVENTDDAGPPGVEPQDVERGRRPSAISRNKTTAPPIVENTDEAGPSGVELQAEEPLVLPESLDQNHEAVGQEEPAVPEPGEKTDIAVGDDQSLNIVDEYEAE